MVSEDEISPYPSFKGEEDHSQQGMDGEGLETFTIHSMTQRQPTPSQCDLGERGQAEALYTPRTTSLCWLLGISVPKSGNTQPCRKPSLDLSDA
jgi:hypothetical protein